MTDRPKAMQLADALAQYAIDANTGDPRIDEAATGLRRLAAIEAERDALLGALKIAVRQNEHDMLMTGEELRQCRAAIAKAKGGGNES